MSSDRRFEYEKGPRLEEVHSSGESDDEDDADANQRERPIGPAAALAAGLVWGMTAVVAVLAVTYQLVASMMAVGMFGTAETKPSRWVLTRLTALANHGATIEVGGEPLQTGFSMRVASGFSSHVMALIPVFVLLAAGYLLVRYVRLETRLEAGFAIGSLVASYVILFLLLARITEWTPEGEDAETLAVATDFGTAVSITRTALVFVAVGAAIAALPRILEAAPFDLARDVD